MFMPTMPMSRRLSFTACSASSRMIALISFVTDCLLSLDLIQKSGARERKTPASASAERLPDGGNAPFGGSHSNGIVEGMDEYLSVPDLTREGGLLDGGHNVVHLGVFNHHLDAGFRDEVHLVRLSAHLLLDPFGLAMPFDLRDREPGVAYQLQRGV